MPTNVIVNGTFDAGATGWSGTDIDAAGSEDAYLGTGSSNVVAEMDGQAGQTTVMEQDFTVENALTTELTLDVALGTASNGDAGSEGFEVEILDSVGTVIATMTVLPTTNSFVTIELPVTFAASGTYTLRMTEIGPDNSLGAIVDNVALLVCFAGGTRIETPSGSVAVERLAVGDSVETQNGPERIRWIGRRSVSRSDLDENPKFRPVRIGAGALGRGLPTRDVLVSRQHRMLANSPIVERMFGVKDTLVSAIKLVGLPGIYVDEDVEEVEYFHILFDRHEIVFAEGSPSESLYLGRGTMASLTEAGRAEIAALFPEVVGSEEVPVPASVMLENKQQNRLVARLKRSGHEVYAG